MDNFYIIIPFNIKKPELGNNINSSWLDYRMEIFQQYTLKSLKNQSDKNFKILMICCPESKEVLSPKIEKLNTECPDFKKVKFVFNLNNTCKMLNEKRDPLYFLKIDSDDLYHRDTIRLSRKLLDDKNDITLAMFCNGFVYSINEQELSIFKRSSITTYVTFFPSGTFSYDNFCRYCMCDQTKVRERFNPIINMDNMVCLIDHDRNMHNDPRRQGMEIRKRTGQSDPLPKNKIKGVLVDFGIWEANK